MSFWTEAKHLEGVTLRRLVVVLSLLLLSCGVFSSRFSNQFVWDDVSLFKASKDPALFGGFDLWSTHLSLYRPLRVWMYTQLYEVSGAKEFGYHVFATAVHVASTFAVYALLLALRLPWPWLGAALFALHPIHVESIVFIMASFDQVPVALYLLSLAAFVEGMRHPNVGGGLLQVVGVALCVPSLLGSEFAATLAPCAALIAWALRRREGLPIPWWSIVAYHAVLVAYLVQRFFVVGLGARAGEYFGGSIWGAAASTTVMFVDELRLVLWPWPSCPLYTPHAYLGFGELGPILCSLWLGFLALGSVWGLMRGQLAGLPFLFFLLTLGPVSNLIPTHTPMAERYLYLPSVGLSLAVALLKPRPVRGWKAWGMATALACWFVGLGASAHSRVAMWRDELTLFEATAQCCPRHWAGWNNLALAQLRHGDSEEAYRSFRRSVQLGRDSGSAWASFGRAMAVEGINPVPIYEEGLRASGGTVELFAYLAEALQNQGDLERAEVVLSQGLARFDKSPDLWIGLARARSQRGRLQEAEQAFEMALRLNPYQADVWASLGNLWVRLGESDRARAAWEKAVALPRPSALAAFNLGVFFESTAPAQAAQYFRQYLALNPLAPDVEAVRRRVASLETKR